MELTLTSAFSTGGLVGHAAYVLLILSMVMRRMVLLRILVIASALVGIVYASVWLHDPVSTFWESLLVTVNVVQLLITWRQNTRARFSDEERRFAERRLRGLPPGTQRRILDMGHWEELPEGTTLTRNGHVPDALYYITGGAVAIEIGGHRVATCGPGSYVGEMSLIGGGAASADAVVEDMVRLWRLPVAAIEELDRTHPTWLAVLEAGIARDMRRKIVRANREQIA